MTFCFHLFYKFVLSTGYCPKELPASSLTVAPRFTFAESPRRPLIAINQGESSRKMAVEAPKKPEPRQSVFGSSGIGPDQSNATTGQCQLYMRQLYDQLTNLLSNPPVFTHKDAEEMSDPAAQPFVWISKWVDYSDKYGFGYQLCDDCTGVMFNDSTRIVLLPNQQNVHYIERDGTEHYHMMGQTPTALDKKMKLLSYFRRYMSEHLMKAGASARPTESDGLSRIPYLHLWHRTSSGVVMQLTNGTLQVNFLDHTKIILCPLMSAVTFIDEQKSFRTYRFSTLLNDGYICQSLHDNLRYCHRKIGNILSIDH